MEFDLYKEKISWYKLIFTILTTVLAACIGWLVSNIDFPLKCVIILNGLSIVAISIGIVATIYKIRYYLNRMGEDGDI